MIKLDHFTKYTQNIPLFKKKAAFKDFLKLAYLARDSDSFPNFTYLANFAACMSVVITIRWFKKRLMDTRLQYRRSDPFEYGFRLFGKLSLY